MTKRTTLITGGAGGLGKELTMMLLDRGITVVVLDRMPQENLDGNYKKRLKKYITIDLSDLEAVKSIIEQYFVQESIRIDILIINAFPRVFKNFQYFKDQEIIDFVNYAFTCHLILMNYFISKMIENDFGRIIIISSKSGIQGYSTGSLYCSLKAAWITFQESVEKELSNCSRNVYITTICPDSFSDQAGNKNQQYVHITDAIKKIVLKALSVNGSRVYFPVAFQTKFILYLQLFRKFLKLW